MEKLSRRQFLVGSGAIGALAVGGAALAGCASGAAASGAASGDAAAAANLVEVTDVSATEECDIVVCGSGSAGTYAAVRAAELGANVIWLEKRDIRGGTSFIAESFYAPIAQEGPDGIDIDAEVGAYMQYQNWCSYEPGVRAYLENAAEAAEWAIEHGAKLIGMGPIYMNFDEDGSWLNMGTGMLTPLWEYGDSLENLDLRLSTTAVNIVLDDAGKVGGVYAQDADGNITQINAKAVILACGGYGHNEEMKRDRMRVPADRVVFLGIPGQDGEGVNMALAAGALPQAPSAVLYGHSKIADEDWDSIIAVFTRWPASWRLPQEEGKTLAMVNQSGKRFYNETAEYDGSRVNAAVAQQTTAFTLFDENHVKTYEGFDEFDYGSGVATGEFRAAIEANPKVYKADTFEELAEQMGVDPETFVQTVEDYNAMIEGGGQDILGADPTLLAPLKSAPFYAAVTEACAYSTCGGVRGGAGAQAMDADDNPIPGLYVCGLDNGSLYFDDYRGAQGGSAQGNACTSGFIAGKAACEEIGII